MNTLFLLPKDGENIMAVVLKSIAFKKIIALKLNKNLALTMHTMAETPEKSNTVFFIMLEKPNFNTR